VGRQRAVVHVPTWTWHTHGDTLPVTLQVHTRPLSLDSRLKPARSHVHAYTRREIARGVCDLGGTCVRRALVQWSTGMSRHMHGERREKRNSDERARTHLAPRHLKHGVHAAAVVVRATRQRAQRCTAGHGAPQASPLQPSSARSVCELPRGSTRQGRRGAHRSSCGRAPAGCDSSPLASHSSPLRSKAPPNRRPPPCPAPPRDSPVRARACAAPGFSHTIYM